MGAIDSNPNCDTHTGKKSLDNRVHSCQECGYTTHRDVAAAQVIRFSRIVSGGTLRRH
jgi:putative transposase